jgi:ligand-binding sensor domain-containing protein
VQRVNKQRTAVIALGILLAFCPRVSALNPALDISQYAHTPWKAGEGFSKGIIFSIAQTPDGYLWLGTEYGLLRFDGVRSVPWQPPAGQHLPSSEIQSLLVGRDGNLWIGTREGLASWKDGKLTQHEGLAGQFSTLFEDREGTIWAGMWTVSTGRICAIQSGTVRCYGEDGRFGRGVYSVYEDSAGNLWLGAATGLWRWKERHGHFGLPGMRERAELVAGRLDVWSEAGGGTKIDLTIPAAKAYAAARARRRARWSGKQMGTNA